MIRDEFEAYLGRLIPNDLEVERAMNYSLTAPGKRLRPQLLFCVLQDLGIDAHSGFAAAAAIEMVHTYSLIHDDLPAMDDDDLRRGRPTCHKQFGEAEAILAGDGLLTKAFEVLGQGPYRDDQKTALTVALAQAAGHRGMVMGQDLDLRNDVLGEVDPETLKKTDYHKTGDLLTVPLSMGAILADHPEYRAVLEPAGHAMGLAFQIQDDILDYTATAEQMGKSVSDAANHKATYYTLLGPKGARQACEQAYDQAVGLLRQLPAELSETIALIGQMRVRDH